MRIERHFNVIAREQRDRGNPVRCHRVMDRRASLAMTGGGA